MGCRSWMPCRVAAVFAILVEVSLMLFCIVAIMLFDSWGLSDMFYIRVWVHLPLAIPVFWFFVYIRYNRLRDIQTLPFAAYFIGAFPFIMIIIFALTYNEPNWTYYSSTAVVAILFFISLYVTKRKLVRIRKGGT